MLVIRSGEVFNGDNFVLRDIYIKDGVFRDDCCVETTDADGMIDAQGCYVVPGLIDLHFHGCNGADISDGMQDALHTMGAFEAARGITAMCPATMTLPEEALTRAAKTAYEYKPAEHEADLVGINMEGPYISVDKAGAQNPVYIRHPRVDEFRRLQQAAGGLIKLVDLAPEIEGAEEFISELSDEVRISLAHTCADYDSARYAFDLGARHLTHLYNAMCGMHHRLPGPIVAAVEHKDVTAEIIADGVHVHPAMVRLAFKLFGDDRMILISDSLRACGLGDGTYDLGGQSVTVKGAKACVANGSLAGSVSDLMSCLRTAVRDMNIPIVSAIKAVTVNPARALRLDGAHGTITAGAVGNAVLLDKETLEVKQVILRGKLLG